MSQQTLTKIILNNSDYFEDAEEYSKIRKIFNPETYYGKISLWVEMIISPLINLFMTFYRQEPLGIFGILSIHKCVSLWNDWFRYRELQLKIQQWKEIVRSIGGPFISTNDPDYQSYVYADGMQRIFYSFFPKN